MNAVRMQDGQVAVPITTVDQYEEHKRLGHPVHINAKENSGTLETPLHAGGWIRDFGLPATERHFDALRYRAVLPNYPPAKPKGFWARLVALFA